MNKLSGFKILIVEDDQDLREIVVDDFLMSGATVDSVESGQMAIELVQKKHFDAILSDMRMLDGDARFLANALLNLQLTQPPKLFLYSGYNDIDEVEAQQLKIVHIFSKPFKASEMIELVAAYLLKLKVS
jgi:CheY-like chemotaxis protein